MPRIGGVSISVIIVDNITALINIYLRIGGTLVLHQIPEFMIIFIFPK